MATLTLDARSTGKATGSISLAPQQKSFWEHASHRLTTVDGMFDALKVGEYATQWFAKIPGTVHHVSFEGASKAFFKTATLISLWDVVTGFQKAANSVHQLVCSVFNKISNPSHKNSTLAADAKASARSLLSLTNTVTDAANNCHEAGWVNLGKMAPISSGIFYGTDIVGNGLDLKAQVEEVCDRAKERASHKLSDLRLSKLFHKDVHSYIHIFKNSVCIIGSVIGLVSLIAGGPIVLPIIGLVLSSMWIVSKIAAHFYKEMVVEEDAISFKVKVKL